MTHARPASPCRSLALAAALTCVVTLALALSSVPACAQAADEQDTRPAFSLLSNHVSTTKEHPSITLWFRRVSSLDFRVYKVKDPLAFFAGLKELHSLGSERPTVAQEETFLERIARWKNARRSDIQSFFRSQFSWDYRHQRKETQAKQQIALRQPLRYTQFAQVPLLNPAQVVATWRELLPPVRETEAREIPLELPGEGIYVVEAVNAPYRAYTIVIVSDLGLVTKSSPGQVLLFAANRFTGAPATSCDAEVIAERKVLSHGSLGEDGVFEAKLPKLEGDEVVAVARCGTQVAVSDPGGYNFHGEPRSLHGYIYTDKPIYRPGHVVHLKSVLRWQTGEGLAPFDAREAEVRISDPNEKVVFRQTVPVDEFGSLLANFQLPTGAALGYFTIHVYANGQEASDTFEVQEYRRPEFEVIVKPATRFVLQGQKAVATISARYYFGQPVANGRVTYVIHKQPYWSPLNWSDDEESSDREQWWFGGEEEKQMTARLDAQGQAQITVPTPPEDNHRDYSIRIEAKVTDASSREVSGNTIIHTTYGRFLLVVRTDNYVASAGKPANVTVRAMDYQGAPQPNVPLTFALQHVRYIEGHWNEPEVKVITTGTGVTDQDGQGTWTVPLGHDPGMYRIAVEAPSEGRTVSDWTSLWVPGGKEADDSGEERTLELVADKKTYAPGDTARLSIKGDIPGTAVLVSKEGRSVLWHRVVRPGNPAFVDVPIAEGDIGDVYVNIAYLRDNRLFRAEKRVKVPAVSRQLQLTVTADQAVAKPRQPATFSIKVVDAAGKPVKAQVSVAVIDEAVYGVKADTTPDPLRFFYRREYSSVNTEFSSNYSFYGYSGTQQLMLAQRHRPMALADFKADKPAQPQVRKEFPDAIHWIGNLVTGADGTATVQVKYPDTLTTWRLTARAVTADTLVGQALARTTTTKDLIARVITPRFLTQGDEVSVPGIVHNYLPGTAAVTLSMQATGVTAVAAQSPDGPVKVDIPQGGEERRDWRYTAPSVGTASFTATATTASDADAVEMSLPVLPFGVKKQLGAAGSIHGDGTHDTQLSIPAGANEAARTIRVSLAPSLAGPMLGALDYLVSYPYGCTEQTLSSFLPNLLVLRTLKDLGIAPTARMAELDRHVSAGIQRLYDYQHQDGGWGWWKTDENHPFMTAYAVYGLAETQKAGYKVDGWKLREGVTSLEKQFKEFPRAVPDLKAYMLFGMASALSAPDLPMKDEVRTLTASAADATWSTRDRMSPYGRALLTLALGMMQDKRAAEVANVLAADVQKKGDVAWWHVEHNPLLEDWEDTSVEATAFAVRALAAQQPNSPLLEPAVRWLLLNRTFGAWWSSTEQTAMALCGLLDYMKARKEGAGPSSVEVLVNGQPAGTAAFDANSLTAPDPVVVTATGAAGANTIQIRKHGAGALYWSATAEFYDKTGPFERTGSHKLALVRKYFSLTPVQKGNRIVYRESPFTGQAKPGDLLLVRLSAAGSNDWRYLMIEDPLPAGVEAVQQTDLVQLETPTRFWDASRREYRDDRIVFFQQSFTEGHYEYLYLLKVTTPGVFRVMPARISAMYVPDSTATSEPLTLTVTPEAARSGGAGK